MRAMILAAGFGTRVAPISDFIPKPLIPAFLVPQIYHPIYLLQMAGIKEIGINHCHLGGQIEAALGDGRKLGVSIKYFPEDPILGSGGGIRNAADWLFAGDEKNTVVLNSDQVMNADLKPIIDFHVENESPCTLVLKEDDLAGDTLTAVFADKNKVIGFGGESELPARIQTGIQVLARETIYEMLPSFESAGTRYANPSSILKRVWNPLLEDGKLYAFTDCKSMFWKDLGNLKSIFDTHRFLSDAYSDPSSEMNKSVWNYINHFFAWLKIKPIKTGQAWVHPSTIANPVNKKFVLNSTFEKMVFLSENIELSGNITVKDAIVFPGMSLSRDVTGPCILYKEGEIRDFD